MAAADCDIELEDGEINDLEDGEIDEEILLSTESSSNVFSRLEPRHEDQLRDQQDNINSHGVNNRDFVFHRSGPVADRWELQGGSLTPASRERFPRGRGSLVNVRGRGKVFRGTGREMTGRDKSYLVKRGGQRRPLFQRPNLPHLPFAERSRPPYLDKRVPLCSDNERPRLPYPASENFNRARPPHLNESWHASVDNSRPRLPHPSLTERPRVPLMELDEKSWLSHNEKAEPAPAAEQPTREPSPLDEDVDDYRILLQRHRLIQQQLAALEKQENSTLGENNIIDDSFIDIPVEDTPPNLSLVGERNLESIGHSLAQTRNEGVLNTQQFNADRNVTSIATGNEIYNLESAGNLLEGESSGEGMTQKPFLSFKIKPLYNSVPSIKELSQRDLEEREAKKYIETAAEDNISENLLAKKGSQTQSQGKRRGKLSRARKNRRKRKRKVSQGATQANSITNNEAMGNASIQQGGHVDAHNELEARLFSLAGSVVSDLGATDANREDTDKKRERRERLRQWQEKMNKEESSSQKNQQANRSRPKKKAAKPARGDKRWSNDNQRGGDRDLHRRPVNKARFENDDYFEIPMDVESDSTDGPALPLIEEPVEEFPPPPPPLPSADFAASMYMERGQPAMMIYQPGYFHMEQVYPADWSVGSVVSGALDDRQFAYGEPPRQIDDIEETNEQRKVHTPEVSSQDNSDEDDEATLREQLLKSLAVKRKAKLDVGDTKSSVKGSASGSPHVQSPVMVTDKEQLKKQQHTSRQVSFVAPPKHDPVVIKLGEDSDTDESDASDSEAHEKTNVDNKGSGGGLFGGLEMMIKEARKSAEASKVKGSQNASAATPQAETAQQAKADLPPVPKTPDAMDHMPEQMKTEYRRLKERLAQREKTRQPLTNVNQEKEDSSKSITSEVENGVEEDNRHLRELHSYVTDCEENLSKHKKLIQQDKTTLAKMLRELKDKSQSLEVQEANVRKLQQQLEAAQKITLANRMLVTKLHNQAKMVKEKVTKKQVAASNFEEELLRAKSILSAVKRKLPPVSDSRSGRNSPQLESLGSAGNENQKIVITSTISQEIKSSLATKLNKLSTLSKLENKEKRKLGGTEDSSEETEAKKPKTASLPAEGSPASSTPNTPRKSAMAEHIAQEKARLKRIEHELSEKLKLFGRQREEGNRQPSVPLSSPTKSSKLDTSDSKKHERDKTQLPLLNERVCNAFASEAQDLNSKQHGAELTESQEKNSYATDNLLKDGERPEAKLVTVSPEQLERIRKLQAEKEKNGPQFSASSLDLPVSAYERSILCVSLPFGGELHCFATDGDTDSLCGEEQVGSESVVGEINSKDNNEAILCPLEKYKSQLLHFKSYRLSPYFRIEGGFSLTSLTFSNKLDPLWPLCNFDLQGKCNDEDCKFQHFSQCKLSQEQTLQDMASYNVALTSDSVQSKELQENVESFTKAFSKQYQDKMSWEELCILLVNEVKKHRKGNGLFNVSLQPRTWKLNQDFKKQDEYTEESVVDVGHGIVFNKKDKHHAATMQTREVAGNNASPYSEESQEVRYFVEEYNNIETLQASLESSPSDVALWIKLARLQLHQSNSDDKAENENMFEDNVTQALSTLSRGLEENTESEGLWLEYLELYSSQSTQDELREICDQAVEFSPTYSVWWKYLEYSSTYHSKRTVCLRLISFLVANPVDPVELHSHHILEALLYLIQLELFSGHYMSALRAFKAALAKKPQNTTEVPDVSVHLLPSDCCFAWLAYIHVFEFHRPPAPWFDPCKGKPSRMVTKEDFVFPWKPSQQSRAPGEKLLMMFQDALKACRALVKSSSARLTVCLPLYKNLIALERAYGRIDSARGICNHLLKVNPSVMELWLCLAALQNAVQMDGSVGKVYEEALDKCDGHAEVAFSAARYYLEQDEVQKAVSILVKCVHHKFASAKKSPKGEVISLATVSSEQAGIDPVALYRKLLLQRLPYDHKCPPLMPGVTLHNLGREKLFLWLSYCLLLEISPPSSSCWDSLSPESAFETAVHSPLDRQDVQTLWTEYLFYQRDKVLRKERSSPLLRQSMGELVNRCLMSVSTSSSLPNSSSSVWQDYRFHNQVISISLSCVPRSCWSEEFNKYLRLFPGSVSVALWACKHEVERKKYDQAKRISASFLSENPHSIGMWKVAIYIELQRKRIKEARKMYQQATEILPLAATLWKDFLMFELAQSGDGASVQEIVTKSRDIGVDLKDYLNTLLGRCIEPV